MHKPPGRANLVIINKLAVPILGRVSHDVIIHVLLAVPICRRPVRSRLTRPLPASKAETIIETAKAMPILQPAIKKKPSSGKLGMGNMGKTFRAIVAADAATDAPELVASKKSTPAQKKKAASVTVAAKPKKQRASRVEPEDDSDSDDDDVENDNPFSNPDEMQLIQSTTDVLHAQAVRAATSCHTNAARALLEKLTAKIQELETLREVRFETPLFDMEYDFKRLSRLEGHDDFAKESKLHQKISEYIFKIMTPEKLPNRNLGQNIERAWFDVKLTITSSVVFDKPPPDDVLAKAMALSQTPEKDEPIRETQPKNANDFAREAMRIIDARIKSLRTCMMDIHHFASVITARLVIPSFSHHVVLAIQ